MLLEVVLSAEEDSRIHTKGNNAIGRVAVLCPTADSRLVARNKQSDVYGGSSATPTEEEEEEDVERQSRFSARVSVRLGYVLFS